jgi:hypothetical protein
LNILGHVQLLAVHPVKSHKKEEHKNESHGV